MHLLYYLKSDKNLNSGSTMGQSADSWKSRDSSIKYIYSLEVENIVIFCISITNN